MRDLVLRSFLSLLLLSLSITVSSAGILSGAIEAGFDSFTERYSIVEEDTVDIVREFSSRLTAGYVAGTPRVNYLRFTGLAAFSESSYELGARSFVTARTWGSLSFDVDGFVTSKRFRESSIYSYPNDYVRYGGRIKMSARPTPSLSIWIRDALEFHDFEQRTEFDYDFARNALALGMDWFGSSGSFAAGSVGYTNKSIPDSTEISYAAYKARLEYRTYKQGRDFFGFAVAVERRRFAHKPTRSPYWAVSSDLRFNPLVRGAWMLILENRSESFLYDNDNDIYFDYTENKSDLLLAYRPSYRFEAAIGPLFAFLADTPSRDDRYVEAGIKSVVEYYWNPGSWFSGGYEFGLRKYPYYDENPTDAVFSDYLFNRFSILGGVKLGHDLGLNLFLSHEPINRKRAGDDTSTTLFSISLTYAF